MSSRKDAKTQRGKEMKKESPSKDLCVSAGETKIEEARPALVPKLRFPEFRGTEEWPELPLIDTADRSVKWSFIGGPFGSNLKSLDYVPTGVRIIQLQNIGDGEFHDEYRIFTTEEKADELLSNNIYSGEIIMSKMGDPVGRACLIPDGQDRYVMCSDGIRLVVDEAEHDKYFIYSIINSPQFRNLVERTATGSTRKRIGLDELKSLPLQIPKKPEQQKIAECLSSLDELMAAQARKVDALKTHKKGLMQQLFPREGETQPRLRFPEFRDAGEWEVKRVDERGNVLAGKALAVNGPGPLRPYLRTKNVLDGAIELSDVLEMPMTDVEFSRFEIIDGDVLLNEGQSLELVGRTSIYRGEFRGRCAMQNQLLRFRAFSSTCPEFATQIFRKCQKDGTFAGVATKTTSVAHLGSSRFSALELPWPPKLSEQKRIASCLSSIDSLITAETKKLEALKTHKKGLMQQLFPSPETGEA